MERLSTLRNDSFRSAPTLTLFFSEPASEPKLFDILVEKSVGEPLVSKGVRGCKRPDIRRRTIVTAYCYPPLAQDRTADQACEFLDGNDDLLIHPQRCDVHEDQYQAIAEELLRRLGNGYLTGVHPNRSLELYYPLQAQERLSVAIFDLSLLEDIISG